MRQKIFIWLFFIGVLVVPAGLWAIVKWHEQRYASLPVLGPKDHVIGQFQVFDQDGNNTTSAAINGRIVVANFFFTHCPVVCPKMMQQLKRVQSSGNTDLLFISFSVDPERDSIGVLKRYSDKHGIGHNWKLLTGSKREIYRLARKDFLLLATDGDGGPDDFIHSDNLVLIDAHKRIRGFYKGTDERDVDQLIHDIQKLHHERQ